MEFAVDGVTYFMDVRPQTGKVRGSTRALYRSRPPRSAHQPRRAPQSTTARSAPSYREWAQANGLQVSDRGRIPQNIVDQHDEAYSKHTRKTLCALKFRPWRFLPFAFLQLRPVARASAGVMPMAPAMAGCSAIVAISRAEHGSPAAEDGLARRASRA